MRIDEFEFQDRNGNEIEPTKNQLVIYIKSLHKQIAELQKQLKEKERLIERLQGVIDKLRDKKFAGKTLVEAVNAVYEPLFKNKYDEVEEIKQYLKNQLVEIVEKIKKEFEANGDNYCEIRKCTSPYANYQYSWFNYVRFRDYLNTLLKEYQK